MDCVDVTDRRWFKFVALGLAILIAIVAGYNISVMNKNRRNQPVSTGEANGLMIANIFLLILALIILFWALGTMLFHRTLRAQAVEKVTTGVRDVTRRAQTGLQDFLTEADLGLIRPDQTRQVFTAQKEVTSTDASANLITAAARARLDAQQGNY